MTSSTVAGESRTRHQAPPAQVAPDDLRIFKRKPKRKRVQAYRPSPDLLPVLVDERTYASRRRRSHIDAASLLVLVVVLIQLLPSRLVVPDLTSVGRPGLLIGLLLALWWLLSKLHPRLAMTGPQPMRWAFVVYALSLLLSYAAGQFRGMPVLEANSADRALLGALAFMGIVFMTADGVPTRDRLDDVQRVLVYCTAINAVLGILQFITKKDLTQNIVIPGLTLQGELVGLADRADHEPNQLSGGQQQRVAVARALVTAPALVLADEPTGNLDTQSTNDVLAVFDRLSASGRTIVLITHEPDVAERAKRLIRLVDGRIVQDERLK